MDGGGELDQRHAAGPAGIQPDQQHRGVAARRRRRLTRQSPATSANDRHPYVYRTTDLGKTLDGVLGAGIDPTTFVRVVREDPRRRDLLFAGTERGVYVSFDAGSIVAVAAAQPSGVPITDLAVRERRSRRRDARPVVLDPRRHLAAAAMEHGRRDHTDGAVRSIAGVPAATSRRLAVAKRATGAGARGRILHRVRNLLLLAERPSAPIALTLLDSAGKSMRFRSGSDGSAVARKRWRGPGPPPVARRVSIDSCGTALSGRGRRRREDDSSSARLYARTAGPAGRYTVSSRCGGTSVSQDACRRARPAARASPTQTCSNSSTS